MVYFSTKLSLGAQRVNDDDDDDDRHTTTYYYVLIMIMITMMKYVGRQLGRHTPDCSALCESRTRIIPSNFYATHTHMIQDSLIIAHMLQGFPYSYTVSPNRKSATICQES